MTGNPYLISDVCDLIQDSQHELHTYIEKSFGILGESICFPSRFTAGDVPFSIMQQERIIEASKIVEDLHDILARIEALK